MTKDAVGDWDVTAGNNTDIKGINIAEGCAASGINNAIREMMAQLATEKATQDATVFPGAIWGLTLSNDTDTDHDINVTAGSAASDASSPTLITLSSEITKQIDATWSVGDDAGGLDTGSVANSTTYHVYLIERSDTGVVDVLFSTSASSPTMPSNYDRKRRIGSVVTDGSANIRPLSQVGDDFSVTPTNAYSASTIGTSAVTLDLNGTTNLVPTGIRVEVILGVRIEWDRNQTTTLYGLVSDLATADTAPSATISNIAGGNANTVSGPNVQNTGAEIRVKTNTSGQIRLRLSHSHSTTTCNIAVLGYVDRRGKDA